MSDWNGIVSLFIACLELVFLINLLIFAEKNKLNWLAIALVVLLLGYQTMEFLICGAGFSSSFMTYLAFVDITLLPPLNLYFALTLFGYNSKLIKLIFLPAVLLAAYYFFVVNEFVVVKCTVLYATYNYPLGVLYGFLYYSPILISFILILFKMNRKDAVTYPINLKYLIFAHLALIIPASTGFTLMMFNSYALILSMESILCKFALLYCLVIVYFALTNKQKTV
ncbi:MAG: hypothetical protein HXY50_14600 [Ignavibacteriaceae bacterium]|nr:hypothetical protein [Ignavibacteriaceae bacterium]